jgi:hypothetical protein
MQCTEFLNQLTPLGIADMAARISPIFYRLIPCLKLSLKVFTARTRWYKYVVY